MFEYISAHRQLTPQETVEIFELHQMAQDFRREIIYREAHERYCAWYSDLARQHQQELAAMRGEFNVLSQFRQLWNSGGSPE